MGKTSLAFVLLGSVVFLLSWNGQGGISPRGGEAFFLVCLALAGVSGLLEWGSRRGPKGFW